MADVIVSKRCRVGDGDTDAIIRHPEFLGGHDRHGRARTADIGRADHKLHGTVLRQRQRYRRLTGVIEPETTGDAPSLTLIQRRGIMRMVPRRLECLDKPNPVPGRSETRLRAFLRAILQADLDGIQAQPVAKLIDYAFHGESGHRRAGGTVGRLFRAVADHVVSDLMDMFEIIGREGAHGRKFHGSARESPSL